MWWMALSRHRMTFNSPHEGLSCGGWGGELNDSSTCGGWRGGRPDWSLPHGHAVLRELLGDGVLGGALRGRQARQRAHLLGVQQHVVAAEPAVELARVGAEVAGDQLQVAVHEQGVQHAQQLGLRGGAGAGRTGGLVDTSVCLLMNTHSYSPTHTRSVRGKIQVKWAALSAALSLVDWFSALLRRVFKSPARQSGRRDLG